MQRKITLLIITLIMVLTCAAQKKESTDTLMTCECHVVSAENDTPLAFVNVYVKQGIGTITNEDGDFKINASPDETLQISYMGYEKMRIKASELPKEIQLKPLEHTLNEVVVLPVNGILKKMLKVFDHDYKKKGDKQSQYFLRQITSSSHKELVETFVQAKSAVNLRDIAFISGRHGTKNGDILTRPLVSDMNFHHALEIGPQTYDVAFWKRAITPFNLIENKGRVEKAYNDTIEVLNDEEGNKIYCIKLTPRSDFPKNHPIIYGTMYVDAKDFRLLHFKGNIGGMCLEYKKGFVQMKSMIDTEVEINYRYSKGFNEVENIFVSFSTDGITNKAILFNIDALAQLNGSATEDDLKKAKKEKFKQQYSNVNENMLASLVDTNFDELMKKNTDFVKRTTEETELANDTLSEEEKRITHYVVRDKKWDINTTNTKIGNMVNRLAKVGQLIPQEKVYIHMDNTCYFLGDTLWYSAYLRRTSDDKPSQVSGILYVELYNQDGYLMQRQMIDMRNGRGHGNFALNKDWYGGYYELRAYTRWQLNWGVHERPHSKESKKWFINKEMEHRYFRDYDKLYSRVFPVYDAPKKAGLYTKNMTTRALQREFKKDPDGHSLKLSLYPEGGDVIVGVPCRVAFEAAFNDGEFVDGKIAMKKYPSVALAKTSSRGRGVFTIIPKSIADLDFVFTATQDRGTATASLNKIEDTGVALCVKRDSDTWNINVKNVGIKDTLGLTIMHDARVLSFYELNDTSATISIANKDLEQGVNQATVFDTQGRILAERLFFVTRPDMMQNNIHISGMKDTYKPYEKVELTILEDSILKNEKDNMLSLSIHDTENSDFLHDNATMLSEMLLSSEVKGFIPNPSNYFEKDDEEHRVALDLLMMTQGWRRFNWRDMAVKGTWDLTQPDEKTPILTGNLYNYPANYFYNVEEWQSNKEQEAKEKGGVLQNINQNSSEESNEQETEDEKSENQDSKKTEEDKILEEQNHMTKVPKSVVVHSEFVSYDGNDRAKLDSKTNNGSFNITLPKFYGIYMFTIGASDKAKWKDKKKYKWMQSMPNSYHETSFSKGIEYPEYSLRIDFPYPRFLKPYDFYQQHTDMGEGKSINERQLSDCSYLLSEVKVGARHSVLRHRTDSLPALIIDGFEAYNHALDAGMVMATPEYILRSYVCDYGSDMPYIHNSSGKKDYRMKRMFGANTIERMFDGNSLSEDSLYMRSNLNTHSFNSINPNYDTRDRLENIDVYAFYTDYQPRQIGSERYKGSNLPVSTTVIYDFPDDGKRKMYRDRHYIFDGITVPNEFYSPNYEQMKLPEQPTDYRRTLYWNPELKLDAEGKADVIFWNNSQINHITIDAEGLSDEGVVLHGRE